MSLVSSVLSSRRHRPSTSSSRPSGWRINIRLAPLMDSLTALASGLLLRFCIDTVGRYDFKLTGTLVGLWEGVVLLHFLKKAPRSSDPYIGFGLRLFVDFMFTESVARLVLVCIWTALGMVLADIVPAVWDESGLRRVWRGVRRDLYRLGEMVPTVAFFPPARTVRFSPSRVPSSVITEEEAPTELPDTTSIPDPSISVLTTDQTQTHSPAPLSSTIEPTSTTAPIAQEILRRRVPGHFPSGYSDTDTEIGSPRGPTSHSRSRSAGRTARRLSVYPGDVSLSVDLDTSSELSSTGAPEDEELDDDLDDANRSSLSGSTERGEGEGDTTLNLNLNIEEVPEMPVEEQEALLVDTAAAAAAAQGKNDPEEGELTPKQRSVPFYMPPTPSDSAARVHRNRRILEDRDREDKDPISLPPSDQLPQIPDFLEESNTEDWEKIQKEEADVDAERPPTPPEKDRPVSGAPSARSPPSTLPVPPPKQHTQTQAQTQTPSPDTTANPANPASPANDDTNDPDNEGWDTLDSQFLSGPTNIHTTNDHTHTQPPPAYQSFDYDDTNHDDIYDDPPAAGGPAAGSFDPEKETFDLFGPGPGGEGGAGAGASKNPWEAEAQRIAAEAEAQRQAEAEAEAEAQRIADEARRKVEEEEAAAAAAAALKEKEKQRAEKAERMRKEAADEAARQKKRLEEEERERKREQEERKAREEEERKKQEEEERKRVTEEKKRQKEEEERLRLEEKAREEEEKARLEEEERKRLEEEERKRQEQAAAEEEERKRQEKEEADRKEREAQEAAEAEAEARRVKEEEEARQLEAQEQARLQAQREEAERQQRAADEAAAGQPQEGATQLESEQHEGEGESESEPAQVAAHPAPTTESAIPPQTADNAPTEQPNGAGESAQPPAGPDADPLSAPAPKPEHQEVADADAEQHPPVADAEQHPTEHPSEPAFDPHEVESVITEASQVPDKVAERLSNIILLKAQMAEVEEQIGELRRELEGGGVDGEGVEAEEKARLEAELRVKEKILRKMQRKEVRRRDGMPIAMFADGDNDSSTDKLTPRDAEIKVEEKLEQLLAPGAKSISYWINVPTGPIGKKQMPKISALLDRFRLLDYTIADSNNARSMTIEVPEAKFNDWLTAYRISVTQVDDGSD